MPTGDRGSEGRVLYPGDRGRLAALRTELAALAREVRGMRVFTGTGNPRVERNPNGIRLHIGNAGAGSGISMPFDVTQASATTVDVSAGEIVAAVTAISVSAASGLDCSAGTSTTGYVYVNYNLDAGTADAIAYSATKPTSDDDDEAIILAHITKDGSGNISAVSQRWRGDFYTLRD